MAEYLILRKETVSDFREGVLQQGIKMGGRSVMPASAETRIDQRQELSTGTLRQA